MSRCLVTSLDLHDTCIATLHEMATCSRNTTPKHRVPAPGMPWFPQHRPLNAFMGGGGDLSEWRRSRPARTELSQGIFCPGKPENSSFLWFGQKRKEKKKKSWNLRREPAGLGRNISKRSRTFWLAFCLNHVYRTWTAWAAGPDTPSPTTPGTRRNLKQVQEKRAELLLTSAPPGGKYPSLLLWWRGDGSSAPPCDDGGFSWHP